MKNTEQEKKYAVNQELADWFHGDTGVGKAASCLQPCLEYLLICTWSTSTCFEFGFFFIIQKIVRMETGAA